MANDTKTPTQSAPAMQQLLEQSRNKYNETSAKYKASPTADNHRAYVEAMLSNLDLEMQAGTFEGNVEAMKLLTKIAPELLQFKAKKRAEFYADAAGKNLSLQQELSQKQTDSLKKEADSIFQVGLSGAQQTASWVGMARGFAALLKVCGVEGCDEFIQKCDDVIKSAQKSVAPMDYERLAVPGRVIDTVAGDRQITTGADQALAGVDIGKAVEYADKLMMIRQTGQQNTTPAPAAQKRPEAQLQVDTTSAISAAHADGNGIKIKDPAKLDAAIRKAAAKDGDGEHLSAKELIDLNARLVTLEGAKTAAQVIERIRDQSKAGAPALTPQ